MGSESVGSNPLPLFPNPNHNQQQNPSPFSHQRDRDNTCCFHCKKQGHFSINCPEKQQQQPLINNNKTTTVSPSSNTLSSGGAMIIPDMQCPCGGGICYVLISKTEKNPGRHFYKCPARPACRFFQWCDENSSDPGVRVAVVSPYPMCSCGAGPCNRLKVMKEGFNKGRFFFVCPVTKGQGACNFFQWEDETKQSPQPTLAVQESREMVDKTFKQGVYEQYGNEFKESLSSGSVVKGSKLPLTEECPVKKEDEEEVGRSNSEGVHDKILSPLRNLSLSKENNTSPGAKPGQCYRCGKTGHWMKDCIFLSSPCFKCGKTGHWMKDCTA